MSLERRSYDRLVIADRDPQNTDVYPVGQRWVNIATGEQFVCTGRAIFQGSVYAEWVGSNGTRIVPPATVDFFGDGSGIALWRFENNASDDGGAFNGVWIGNEQYATGRDGQAANFDGASRIDVVGLGTGLSVITVSMWVNYTSGAARMLFSWDGKYDVIIWNGGTGFNTFNGDVYGVGFYPTSGVWEHWCFEMHVGDVSQNKIWVNGVPQPLTQISGTPQNANTVFSDPFSIGGSTQGYYFLGLIDHLRVFNRALTNTEVQQLAAEI